jgi:hypothetical protein
MDALKVTLVLTLLAVAGCDAKAGRGRVPISGTVSLSDGEKINGRITFVPAEGRSGPAATTGLINGAYGFDKDNGPIPGPSRVTVRKMVPTSRIPTGSEQRGTGAASGATAGAQSEWTTSVDISANGPYQHDLVLDR